MVGTRFFARGGDSKGNVANFCETEQLVEHAGQVCLSCFFNDHEDLKNYLYQFKDLLRASDLVKGQQELRTMVQVQRFETPLSGERAPYPPSQPVVLLVFCVFKLSSLKNYH